MGSYAECWLGSFYVGSSKNDIDMGIMRLFRFSDKVVSAGCKLDLSPHLLRWIDDMDDDEEIYIMYYHAPLEVIRERLELLGYTLKVCKSEFSRSIRENLERHRNLAKFCDRDYFRRHLEIMESINIDEWLGAMYEIRKTNLKHRHIGEKLSSYEGTLIGYMLDNDWYGYPGPDPNIGIRLAIEICSEEDELVYDLTDLVISGDISIDDDLTEYALNLSKKAYSASDKIIVLTEGRSDSWIISESLNLLYPHLYDYFSFLDFEGAKIGGGAGNLANIVKSFAGAGIANRVLAIFDNDTAADEAIRGLQEIHMPDNIKILQLPSLPHLEHYPTIGPSGSNIMDINGIASSIELYLGNDLLIDEGGYPYPVQWTGYNPTLRKYQGSILFKDAIQNRFRKRLKECKASPDLVKSTDWNGLKSVLNTLFSAVQEINCFEIIKELDEYYDIYNKEFSETY